MKEDEEIKELKHDVRKLFSLMDDGGRFEVLEERTTELNDKLNEILHLLKKPSTAFEEEPFSHFKTNFEKRVEIQIQRSKEMTLWRDGTEDTDPEEFLLKYPTIFEKEIQYVLDFFDFEEAARGAKRLGFTAGLKENTITAESLIEDAIELFDKLKAEKCGKMQLGRLIAYKLWDFDMNEPWYELVYFIEHQQEEECY